MEIQWNANYPGIVIDNRLLDDDAKLNPSHWTLAGAFTWAAYTCLNRIESKPIGRDLLRTISLRCQGVGAGQAALKCRVIYGQGTLTELDRYVFTAIAEGTNELPDVGSYTIDQIRVMDPLARRRTGRFLGVDIAMAGKPMSAMASFNPFINYDVLMQAKLGVPFPAFICLAHELVHALHRLSGDRIPHNDPKRQTMIEEARTVGAGKYRNTRISENAIRAEHGIAVRKYYDKAGDCWNP